MKNNTPEYWNEKQNVKNMADINEAFNNEHSMGKSTLAAVLEFIPREEMILDAGCGDGRYVFALTGNKYCNVYGCDFAEDRIKQANKLSGEVDNRFVVGNVLELPYGDNIFDVVLSVGVLHHLKNDEREQFFNEMIRVLKPGGRVFLTVPKEKKLRKIISVFKNLVFVNYLKIPELRMIFEYFGFDIIKIKENKHNIFCWIKIK